MKRRNLSLFAVSAMLLIAGDHRPRHAGAADSRDAGTPAGRDASAFAAGQILNVDPTTGKLVDTPAQSIRALQDAMGSALSTSGEGLVAQNSPIAGGGVVVDLQGRFQNAVAAVVDANGVLQAPCIAGATTDAPAPSTKGSVK